MVVLAVLSLAAQAQASEPLRDPAEQGIKERESQRREELLRFEQDAPTLSPGPQPESSPEAATADDLNFVVRELRLEGDAQLIKIAAGAVEQPWQEKPIGVSQINALLDSINRRLIDAGFITSRAYVGPQNLGSGVLIITLVSGKVEAIYYNGKALQAAETPTGVRLAMALQEKQTLRLQAIEQSVDQLNRLQINNAQVQIKPGDSGGGSIVEFVNAPAKGGVYSLSLDNQGSDSSGKWRVQGSAEYGNVMGWMERLSLGLSTSKETNALFGSVSLPLGYNTLSANVSVSEYQNLMENVALVYGRTNNGSLAFSRLLTRNQSSKMLMDFSLARRQSKRSINSVALKTQILTVARLGVSRLQRLRLDKGLLQWTLDLAWVRGLPWLGADRDASHLAREAARAQFDKFEATLSLDAPVSSHLYFRSRLDSQWTRHPLYGSEQLYVGGMNSVRGLAESSLQAERGALWRNELLWSLPPFSFAGKTGRIEPFAFVDGAVVQTVADQRWQRAHTAGLGARLRHDQGSMEINAGKPFKYDAWNKKEGARIDLRFAWFF